MEKQSRKKHQIHETDNQDKSQSQDNKNEMQTRERDFNEWLQSSVPEADQEIFDKAFDESERLSKLEEKIEDIKGKPATTYEADREKEERIELLKIECGAVKNWLDTGTDSPSTWDDDLPTSLKCQTEAPPEEPLSGTPDASEKIDSDNYFICSGDFWRIRFKGGKEISIRALDGIWYVANYISHPGKQVDRSLLYNIRKSAPPGGEKVHGNEELSTSGSFGFEERPKEHLTEKELAALSEKFQELSERIDSYKDQGLINEAEKAEDEYHEKRKKIESLYNAWVDPATNSVKNTKNRGTGRYKDRENVQDAIKTAIRHIQKADCEDLVTHLEKYLLQKKDIYLPPSDFPDWHVEI